MTTKYYSYYNSVTMIYTATVTQKGQVTIPADIRKLLGIKAYKKVIFKKFADGVVIAPATNFLSLKGSIKIKKPYTDEDADQAVLASIKKEYE